MPPRAPYDFWHDYGGSGTPLGGDDEWMDFGTAPELTVYGSRSGDSGGSGGSTNPGGSITSGNMSSYDSYNPGMSFDPILGAINALANLGFGIYDRWKGDAERKENLAAQKEQRDYERSLQERIFDREDNAVWRRVQDMKRSGINPVMAAGAAAQAGSVVNTSAPQRDYTPSAQGQWGKAVESMMTMGQIARTQAETSLLRANAVRTEQATRIDAESLQLHKEMFEHDKQKWTDNLGVLLSHVGIDARKADSYAWLVTRSMELQEDQREMQHLSSQDLHKLRTLAMDAQRTANEIQKYYLDRNEAIPASIRGYYDLLEQAGRIAFTFTGAVRSAGHATQPFYAVYTNQ